MVDAQHERLELTINETTKCHRVVTTATTWPTIALTINETARVPFRPGQLPSPSKVNTK